MACKLSINSKQACEVNKETLHVHAGNFNEQTFDFHILESFPPNPINDICHSKGFIDHLVGRGAGCKISMYECMLVHIYI